MFAVWSYAPLAALAIFLGLSCLHFSEDWAEVVPPFFAVGLATAMLSAPALLHGDVLAGVFQSLTGSRDARVLADIGMLMAPVALTSAGIGVWLIAQAGQPVRACQTAILLFGMIVLPPVLGFALFFCLAHSPVQFAKAKAELQIEGRGATNREIVALTMGALAIAVVMFALAERGSFVENSIRASFVTLSILTAPHMAVPLCVSVWNRRRGAIA